MPELRGVIFDVDGTLLSSNEAHAHAWVDAFSAFGWEVPFFRIKWLIGMGGDRLLSVLFPGMSDEEGIGHVITQYRKRIFMERYTPHLEATPGARDLASHLKERGLKLVISTSSKQQELAVLLQRAGVEDLFEEATTASDVDQTKPAPDPVHAALEKLDLPPEEVVMVGDTPYDVESAQKAGVALVAVRSGGWDDGSLEGAIAIYDSPADILAHVEKLPLATQRRRS